MQPGQISHYRVFEKLGEGGMGIVYRAEDTRLGRTVALKTVKLEYSDRFEREARAIAALNHPNICTLHDVGVHEGVPFLVMEYVEGAPLTAPLPLREAIQCGCQIAAGLAAAHARGIVHRDLKPANVRIAPDGRAKILDFGLAKVVAPAPTTDMTMTAGLTTLERVVVGTPAYMSPEQAEGKPVDARTDVFSFGILLYELVTGIGPFMRGSHTSTLAAILKDEPVPVVDLVKGVPDELQRVISTCLAKDKEKRYASAAEVLKDLTGIRERMEPTKGGIRRPAIVAAALVLSVAIVAAGWLGVKQYQIREAYDRSMPEIARLADSGDYVAAFRLARRVRGLVGNNPEFQRLVGSVTNVISIGSEPAGAEVKWKGYVEADSAWEPLGKTPLKEVRVPRGFLRWRIEREGFESLEFARPPASAQSFKLFRADSHAPGMILVAGGSTGYRSAGPAKLDDFWLDRHEVSNREFKSFLDRGGYGKREYWKHAFQLGEREVSSEEAMARFVDSTGRRGPATWEFGEWPEGQGDYPVGGVSWYEAAAFCESEGKSLPTLFHWYKAAAPSGFPDILKIANIGSVSKGPAARGRQQAVTAFGHHDMAGNLKEWAWNDMGGRRAILGGAWNESTYMFYEFDAQSPFERRPTFGFRCARYEKPPDPSATKQLLKVDRDFTRGKPVGEDVYRVFRSLYSYEPADLSPRVEAVDTSIPHWRWEKISFSAAYGGERVVAYLYLPAGKQPPYQTVVYFPGSEAFAQRSVERIQTSQFEFLVRSGRAVLLPAYKGSYDRFIDSKPVAALSPSALRDRIIWWAKDLGRSLDFIATRQDLLPDKTVYVGTSLGGCDALPILAIEERFKAIVLIAGGVHADHRYLPEDDPINFLPRIRAPLLLIGGRDDFLHPLESSQKPLLRLIGTPEKDKRHIVVDAGHILPRDAIMKDVLVWLDQRLGPVSDR